MKSCYLRILARRILIKLSRHVANLGSSNKQQLDTRQTTMLSQSVSSAQLEKFPDAKCYNSIVKKNNGKIAEVMRYGC